MFRLIYVSSAHIKFSECDLVDLMAQSRERNVNDGITGLLLYKDGNFLQVLEGEQTAVLKTYARIARDVRHHGLIILLQERFVERTFPEWSMAFRDLNSPEVVSSPSFSPFLNTALTGHEFSSDPSRCEKFLLTFKKIVG